MTFWIFVDTGRGVESPRHCHAHAHCNAKSPHEMAVAVRVLLVALLGLYWSSSRVEGNSRDLISTHKCLLHYLNITFPLGALTKNVQIDL